MLEAGAKLGIAAGIPKKIFVRRFHLLYWPWLVVLLVATSVLLLDRTVLAHQPAILKPAWRCSFSGTTTAFFSLRTVVMRLEGIID
jgi:hypothetical protein